MLENILLKLYATSIDDLYEQMCALPVEEAACLAFQLIKYMYTVGTKIKIKHEYSCSPGETIETFTTRYRMAGNLFPQSIEFLEISALDKIYYRVRLKGLLVSDAAIIADVTKVILSRHAEFCSNNITIKN